MWYNFLKSENQVEHKFQTLKCWQMLCLNVQRWKQDAINALSFLQLEIQVWDFALKKKNENLCNDIGKVNYSLFLLVLY